MAPDFRRHRTRERDDTSRPVLITGARESYQDELAARKKRYFILMSVRIPALVLAAGALALWNNPWIALAIVIGSIPVPWIAVIGANDRPPLPKGEARRYTAGGVVWEGPRALPPSVTGGTHGSPAGRPSDGDDDADADRAAASGGTASQRAPDDSGPTDPTGPTGPRSAPDTDTDTDTEESAPEP